MPLTDLSKPNGKPNMGGTFTKAYVFEIEDLDLTALPELSALSKLDVIDDIVFKAAKKMAQVYCTPTKGKLDGNTVGEINGLSNENIVEIFYPGKEQTCAEWKAYMLNRAVGLIVPDTNGNNRLVGICSLNPDTVELSVELPAYLTGASTSGGAACADLAGTTFTFSAPARHDALYYKGALTLVGGV